MRIAHARKAATTTHRISTITSCNPLTSTVDGLLLADGRTVDGVMVGGSTVGGTVCHAVVGVMGGTVVGGVPPWVAAGATELMQTPKSTISIAIKIRLTAPPLGRSGTSFV